MIFLEELYTIKNYKNLQMPTATTGGAQKKAHKAGAKKGAKKPAHKKPAAKKGAKKSSK